jgi:xanthine dehydrogenase YagT iron-sulfur-binding subunit
LFYTLCKIVLYYTTTLSEDLQGIAFQASLSYFVSLGGVMKKPKDEAQDRKGFSRRHFFGSVASGAAGTAVLANLPAAAEAQTQTGQAPRPAAAAASPAAAQAASGEMVRIALNINGQTYSLSVEPRWSLQFLLRDRLGLTGTKDGCQHGECGACTVLIDGIAQYSCMTLAVEAVGTQITTVEGLMSGQELGPVQQAFVEEDAMQCGYCIPGQVVAAEALLCKTPQPTREQIRLGMSGNLCRCAAYGHILNAVERAAQLKNAGTR